MTDTTFVLSLHVKILSYAGSGWRRDYHQNKTKDECSLHICCLSYTCKSFVSFNFHA